MELYKMSNLKRDLMYTLLAALVFGIGFVIGGLITELILSFQIIQSGNNKIKKVLIYIIVSRLCHLATE